MAYEKTVPDWQETGSDIPESKLTTGWQESEKPPANWFNRFFYAVSQAIKELQSKSAEVEYVDKYVDALHEIKVNKESITDSTGTSSELVMSQKGVTDAINNASGISTETLNTKIDKSSITDNAGINSELVMSQKGVTEELNKKLNKEDLEQSVSTSTSKFPCSLAIQNYVNEKIPTISCGTVLPSTANEGDIFILY